MFQQSRKHYWGRLLRLLLGLFMSVHLIAKKPQHMCTLRCEIEPVEFSPLVRSPFIGDRSKGDGGGGGEREPRCQLVWFTPTCCLWPLPEVTIFLAFHGQQSRPGVLPTQEGPGEVQWLGSRTYALLAEILRFSPWRFQLKRLSSGSGEKEHSLSPGIGSVFCSRENPWCALSMRLSRGKSTIYPNS